MNKRCIFAWTHIYIEQNGTVRPCCAPVEFGSLERQSVPEAFCSEEANRIRASLSKNTIEAMPLGCRNCLNLVRLADINDEETFISFFPLNTGQLDILRNAGCDAFVGNYRALKEAYLYGKTLSKDTKPLQLMIQLGERCNLRCIMCPQDHSGTTDIALDSLGKIKEWIPYLYRLSLTGGEPLVYDSFWELADCFRKHATPVAAFTTLTNGILLKKDKILKYLDGINNVAIGVNIDACEKNTYEKIRVGASWELLMQNLRDYIEIGKGKGKNWRLSLAFTIMKSNIDQLRGGIELAAKLGAGFGCGMVTGDYGPVKNCRTYFKENLFRFSHVGYSRDYIIAKLEEALRAVGCLAEEHREGAAANLKGVIDYARNIERIDIPAKKSEWMFSLDDNALSQEILFCINPKNNLYQKSKRILGAIRSSCKHIFG